MVDNMSERGWKVRKTDWKRHHEALFFYCRRYGLPVSDVIAWMDSDHYYFDC